MIYNNDGSKDELLCVMDVMMMISKQAQSSEANAMMKRIRHPKFASEMTRVRVAAAEGAIAEDARYMREIEREREVTGWDDFQSSTPLDNTYADTHTAIQLHTYPTR
jgi:hypothetical protein